MSATRDLPSSLLTRTSYSMWRLLVLVLSVAVVDVVAQASSASASGSSAAAGWPRLQREHQRGRATLRLVAAQARSALAESVHNLQAKAAAAQPASAAAADAAVAASASLVHLWDDVRQAARSLLDHADGAQAQKGAQQCAGEARARAQRALGGAVAALGRCASVASASEQEAARRLARLLQEAERRAAEAERGAALDACARLPRLKAALDCITRQVLSARAEVLGRADAGVRGARALGGDAAQAERSAVDCVQRQADAAHAQVSALVAWMSACAAAAASEGLPQPPVGDASAERAPASADDQQA